MTTPAQPDPAAQPDLLLAPWTPEQVAALNAYQRCGQMHPFTCGKRDRHRSTNAGVLVAVEHGWTCPALGCDYRQNWAHPFMATGPWPRPTIGPWRWRALLGGSDD